MCGQDLTVLTFKWETESQPYLDIKSLELGLLRGHGVSSTQNILLKVGMEKQELGI